MLARMLDFDEALRLVLDGVPVVGSEKVAGVDAFSRVLAERLDASENLPAFDYSAMDGYAVSTSTFSGEGPWQLPVRGESKTGMPAPLLDAGAACRIFTGAPMPEGANSVVMQENVERAGDVARFEEAPQTGSHVRRAGEDVRVGQTVLLSGTRLGAFHLGAIASLDRADVLVAKRPRVRIICTGDELRPPGSPRRPGTIPESNGASIAAMATLAGATAERAPLTADDQEATRRTLADALGKSDLVVTIGGVSVGDYDVVRPALEAAGAVLDFWKVRIKPGKPLVLGHAGDTRVLGLPGNPVSAQITFALFGMPLLRAMQGDESPVPPRGRAVLESGIEQKPGRLGFYRARVDGDSATPLDNQSSGSPISMALANALVLVPADSHGLAAGESAEILRLSEL